VWERASEVRERAKESFRVVYWAKNNKNNKILDVDQYYVVLWCSLLFPIYCWGYNFKQRSREKGESKKEVSKRKIERN